MKVDAQQLSQTIARCNSGDEDARRQLFELANDRLLHIAQKMLRGYPGVKRWEQTDDLWQNASLKLWQSLRRVQLKDARHFYSLAALHIRREAIGLIRRYYGPQGMGANHATTEKKLSDNDRSAAAYEAANESLEGRQLAVWTEFHHCVSQLADEEREVFDLVWYQGLPQAEAAALLKVSVRTIKRRWQTARLSLSEQLGQSLPDL